MNAMAPRQPFAPGSLPARLRYDGRHLLMLAIGVFGVSLVAGASIGASRLGLFVPPASSGSLGDAIAILVNNLQIWALLMAVALFQPCGVPGLTRGFLPLWLTDLTVVMVISLNLVAIGGVLGALGLPALLRMVAHAPLELGGFVVAVIAYLHARRGQLQRRDGVRRFALACALLICGSFVESYVSGGLG